MNFGHLGLDAFIERRGGNCCKRESLDPISAPTSGAAQGPANILQASDDPMEQMMVCGDDRGRGLRIDRRHPRDAAPLGEARNIHHGGGRFISIIGKKRFVSQPGRSRT